MIHDVASFDGLICTKAFTSLMLCGLLIAYQLRGELSMALTSTLDEHIRGLATEAERILALLRANDALRNVKVPYFLSHAVGMSIAHAGALYMHEGALTPAIVDSIGMFHHGPMECADEAFTALWIDLEPDLRSLDIYRRIREQGATLVPVGVDDGPYSEGFLFPWADVPAPFRCLPAALVVQLYTWWLADCRGHQAGEMRHLQWLVT